MRKCPQTTKGSRRTRTARSTCILGRRRPPERKRTGSRLELTNSGFPTSASLRPRKLISIEAGHCRTLKRFNERSTSTYSNRRVRFWHLADYFRRLAECQE